MLVFVKYRRYRKNFSFNNKFHLYIRSDQYFDANARLRKIAMKFFRLSKIEKTFTIIVYVETNFIIKVIKITSIVVYSIVVAIISIVVFDVDSFKDIDIDCDCRDSNYVKTIIVFSKIVTSKNDCLNTRFDVILIDKIF